jgi:hypothetical protein
MPPANAEPRLLVLGQRAQKFDIMGLGGPNKEGGDLTFAKLGFVLFTIHAILMCLGVIATERLSYG